MPLVNTPTLTPQNPAASRSNHELTYGQTSRSYGGGWTHGDTMSNRVKARGRQAANLTHRKNTRSKPKTPLESTRRANEPSIYRNINDLLRQTEQVAEKYTNYSIFYHAPHEDAGFEAIFPESHPGDHREAWLNGNSEKMNIENEGESHDIIENKGRNFLSHDVHDK